MRTGDAKYERLAFQACNNEIPSISDFSRHQGKDFDNYLEQSKLSGRLITETIQPSLVQHWLRKCEQNHKDSCGKHTLDSDKRGIFVIDVNKRCIIEKPVRCRYVALSYVWGSVLSYDT